MDHRGYRAFNNPKVNGQNVRDALVKIGLKDVKVKTVTGPGGKTDFVKVWILGSEGKRSGGHASTLGIVGRLGGIGARPERLGLVSDADGGIAAVAAAMLLGDMHNKGDVLREMFLFLPVRPTLLHNRATLFLSWAPPSIWRSPIGRK